MNIRIAWRNIWRNKKRTLITISSVTFAVLLAVFTRSFQEGSYDVMIENAIGQYTGYVQVHQKDFWDDKSLDNGILINDSLLQTILSTPAVMGTNQRLESFSLASYGNNTKGAIIFGIDPDSEEPMLKLESKIVKGQYIQPNDKSIILGSKLADYLHISVGDTLVLLGQGHWGQSAIGAYPIKGIVKMMAPDIDRQIIYMPLLLAQEYFSFENGVSSIVVKFEDASKTPEITDALNARLDTSQYKAMSWQEMSPVIEQQIVSDKVSGIFMIAILYMIIAFGVFGTVLMMTEERKREFAIMVAIGTQKTKLMMISIYEALLMNFLAIILGVILSIPLVYYYHIHPIRMTGEAAESMLKFGMEPILPTLLSVRIFINQVLVVMGIVAVASFYPIVAVFKMKIIKSLRR